MSYRTPRLCHRTSVLLIAAACFALSPALLRADRASENMDPAWMFEKKKQWAKAAMYYGRAVVGLREVYMAFHWDRDPAKNAAGKYATEYAQLPVEMENRYRKCLANAKLTPAQRDHMLALNDLWLSELIDHEEGGQRITCGYMAAEAERHGDFRLAELMRRGKARYLRSVVIPYHRGKAGASLHDARVKSAEAEAAFNDRLAKGNDVLRRIRGFGGLRYYVEMQLHPQKVNPVSFQYLDRRLWKRKTKEWIGPKPDDVATMLRKDGLTHKDDNVRLSAVNVLGHLGKVDDLIATLGDASSDVRLVAAEAIARTRRADGWATCVAHKDPAVRGAVAPLLTPAGNDPLARTWVIGELIRGLNATDAKTRAFCQASLEKVSGRKLAGPAWAAWWKQLGNARPGLRRADPDGRPAIDETIDFGTWWQAWIHQEKGPFPKYAPPTTITWNGYLVVDQTGTYRFTVRNCGEKRSGANTVRTPGRPGFPGLYLSRPAATLFINGKKVLPHPVDTVQDPNGGIRLDMSDPLRLSAGLHAIRLVFEYRSKRANFSGSVACLRLYWESEHFLREVVPAPCLVTTDRDAKPETTP